jgi:hypothetical protein
MTLVGNSPEELAFLQPFLQKAHEIEAKEKIVAYYCELLEEIMHIRFADVSQS